MSVAEILSNRQARIVCLRPEQSINEAMSELQSQACGALPVVTQRGDLVGILSERDFARSFSNRSSIPADTTVADLMSMNVIHINLGDSCEHCLELMDTHQIRHLPVKDDQGELIGFLTVLDVIKFMLADQSKDIRYLETYVAKTWPF